MPTIALISDMYSRVGDHRYMHNWAAWWLRRGFSVYSIFVEDLLPGLYDSRGILEDELHNRLTEDSAVAHAQQALLERLISLSPHVVLGFSYGGFLAGSVCDQLSSDIAVICISATRLRQILPLPRSDGLYLIFAENDPFKPETQQLASSGLSAQEVPNAGHEIYRDIDTCAVYVVEMAERMLLKDNL